MKSGRAPEDVGLINEMMRTGDVVTTKTIKILMNKCLVKCQSGPATLEWR